MKKVVFSNNGPKPVGPYSQAVRVGNILFISGMIPIDPASEKLVEGEIEQMTERILENIKIILNSENLSMENIVKTNLFLKDMQMFGRVNSVYEKYFKRNPPARSAVGVSALPKNAEIEIEAIAYYEN
ncbi:MAG: hypothetical protein COX48_02335 [bacterium (Candidatus Stahlbacteria) CG23_combo_of_CG06-09_8_20_14_all_34_7]|nr:MAG: hypothetical protein COX48_02335 [bacterium (Candidatus Stahlbacteria) CG23_combo_of_CG06-09_8_20_14_all_34_7]